MFQSGIRGSVNLFTFKIPEIEHLPVAEREELVKHWLASKDMRRYKRIAALFFGIVPTALAISFLTLSRWNWSFPPAFIIFVAIFYIFNRSRVGDKKIALEVLILRRLIRD